MILKLLDFIHMIIVLNPLLFLILPKNIIKKYIKWFLLFNIFIPLHWHFFNNKCMLTEISKYFGGYKGSDSNFTEKNLKWLHMPNMNIFGWKLDKDGINKMSTLHWLINIFICWYLALYVYIK